MRARSSRPVAHDQQAGAAGPAHRDAARPPLAVAGNQQALRALGIRPKLTVSQPGDPDEQEADRAADAFVSGEAHVHRACAGCTSEDDKLMRSAGPSGVPSAGGAHAALSTVSAHAGAPLAAPLRTDLERFFGADLRGVRIHDHARAAGAAEAIAARAYAVGDHVAFAAGEFSPQAASGRRLLAHEIAHVVQQRRASSAAAPTVARDAAPGHAVMSDEQWQAMRVTLQDAPTLTRFSELPGTFRTAHAMGGDDYVPYGWEPGNRSSVDLARARERDGFKCPTSACHSVADAFRKEGIERARIAIRHQRWEELYPTQYEEELKQLPASLTEDIQITQLSAAATRAKLFDLALAAPKVGGQSTRAPLLAAPPPSADVTASMRDTWALAQQATMVMMPFLRGKDDIPPVLAGNARAAYDAYYRSLGDAVRAKDHEDRRDLTALDQFNEIMRPRGLPRTDTCPGPCRLPRASPATPLRSSSVSPGAQSRRTLAAWNAGPYEDYTSTLLPGEREQQLVSVLARLSLATSKSDWQAAVRDFEWATHFMDELLKAQVPDNEEGKKAKEELKFATELLAREEQLLQEHPDAQKIQAIFYPKDEGVYEPTPDGRTCQMAAAKGVAWQFYLTHTPVASGSNVPEGFEWELHDLTAPKRPDGRSVKTHVQLDRLNAWALEYNLRKRGEDIREMNPYPALFEALDDADFFPEGEMYWRQPNGKVEHMTMHAAPSFWDWLKNIGMAIALLGSLIFAPFSIPMLVSFGVGTALATVGRIGRLEEKEEHGVLEAGEWRGFFWDLALDVLSAATLGFGRLAKVAFEAGQLLRAASLQRSVFLLEKLQFAADVVNVGLLVDGVRDQYLAIMKSDMTPAQKRAALEQLTTSAFASGLLSLVPVVAHVRSMRRNAAVSLEVDPANPKRLVANFEEGAELAGHTAPAPVKAGRAPSILTQETVHLPNGETHTYAVLSDGRVIRCSDGCGHIADSVADRLDDLGLQIIDATHTAEAEALRSRVMQLKAEGEIAAADSSALLKRKEGGLIEEAKAIDRDFAQLEQKVATANEKTALTGRETAQQLYGESALAYDTKKYRWVRRKDGTLEFQRRSRNVPHMEFNPATREFRAASLFETLDAEKLQLIRESSVTRDFPIVATVDSLEQLNKVRPRTPYKTAAPRNYVLVKVNDQNAFDLLDEPLRLGEVREFPDGSRVWLTPQGTSMTEGWIRQSTVGRMGWEQGYHSELRSRAGVSNEGVPLRDITGVEHQRSHVRGRITGFEYSTIPYAPTYVNQQLQAKGIELFTSSLEKAHPEKGFMLRTEHKLIPDTRRQAWIDYHISIVEGGKQRDLVTVRIGTDYENLAAPANYEIRGITSNEADQALLLDIDMPAARAELEQRIRAARERRRQGR